jgi:pyridoxine kinase
LLTINDISCLGKCSLTVERPCLRHRRGVRLHPHGTALHPYRRLHRYTFLDLADQILPIARHWKSEGFRFDGIFTG